jgi:hypothetical protein
MLLTVSCSRGIPKPDVNFTPCVQDKLKISEVSDNVVVEFTNEGVHIMFYNFEVTCDFTTVNVTHTFVNGVLRITQQGFPNEANCLCYTDVSYTIDGITQNAVNVIFINGVQVYCYNDNQSTCDKDVIISQYEYENAPDDFLVIEDLSIQGNCLKIKFGSSGCSGDTWVEKLIDMGTIAYSDPIQRTLRLSLDNLEECEAWITKEISFNIKDLQLQGDNIVQLNVSGQSILYEY